MFDIFSLIAGIIVALGSLLGEIAYVNKFKAYSYGSGFSDVMGD